MKKKKSSAEQTIEAVEEILMDSFKPAPGHILCLKSLPANMQAYQGFQWPEAGSVKAPDWRPTESCGNGLHAFRWGSGDVGLACGDEDAKWLILQVKEEGIIDLDGKVKFEECFVMYCGKRDTAISILEHHAPAGTAIMYGTATAGEWGILIVEYWNKEAEDYRKKIALVDGVNYLPGVKYRLNSDYEFEQINETEA